MFLVCSFIPVCKAGRTLHDPIHAKAVLQVVCQQCRHQKLVYPFSLGRSLEWTTLVDDLVGRFRCSQCGFDLVTVYEATR